MFVSKNLPIQTLLTVLRAAGEETRLRLLVLLSHGELTVSELTQILLQSQPRVSRHLKLLCDAGLLQRTQESSWVFYRLADSSNNAQIARQLIDMLDPDDGELNRDRARLNKIKQHNQKLAEEYFNLVAEEWDQIRERMVADSEVEALMLKARPQKKVRCLLDLGTGTGRILELFSQHIEQGLGVDMSHEMLTIARANLDKANIENCHVRQGDIRDLPLDDDSFDLITIHQVLHYLDDPASVIRESARLLSDDGRLLIIDFQPHQVEQFRADHAHRRLGFSDQEVMQWCTDNPLKLIESKSLKPTKGQVDNKLTVTLWILTK